LKKSRLSSLAALGITLLFGCGKEAAGPVEPVAKAVVTPQRTAASQAVHDAYDATLAQQLVPLLTEVVKFPTYEGNDQARIAQRDWLAAQAAELGFEFRDAGTMYEVTLPGPEGAQVLGLLVHGDVVKVEEANWSFPPFDATVVDGMIQGRGVADDKGPLIQALLAMKALADAGPERKVAIRLIVGTAEESTGDDIRTYLETNEAPRLSLVLDSAFPTVIGEKAWNALYVYAPIGAPQHGDQPWVVEELKAGLSTSIVPDEAKTTLLWVRGTPEWAPLIERLRAREMPEGRSLDVVEDGPRLTVNVHGVSAHAGDTLRDGRNALVAMANLLAGELPDGSASQLLAFAAMAGSDLDGGGLGINQSDPVWGTYDVNVATILPDEDDPSRYRLAINVRRIPPWTQEDLKSHLQAVVAAFNAEHGTSLGFGGYWDNEPLVIDGESPAVKRLMAVYERETGESPEPDVSSGGTYAKRTPRSIVFGMWFPGTPYPGHGVDERVSVEDLHRGTHVLIEALVDLVCSEDQLPAIVRQGAAVED